MRFHCLGVQHTITNKEYIACAFTQKVPKFCEMMTRRGHTVVHYGHEDSNVLCTEHVTVMPRDVFNTIYGVYDHRQKLFTHDQQDQVYKHFNQRAIEEIRIRKQPGDFLLAFWGVAHRVICDAHSDLIIVEPGIGYSDTFAPHKVFESYAVYHAYLTLSKVARCFVFPSEYERDAIIPNYFDPTEFEFTPDQKEDYFLFIGRIGVAKGLGRAIKMTQRLGARLIVAGQNAEAGFKEEGFWPIPDHVTHVGYVGVEERKRLLARAKAVVCFSTFVEPFCGVHVEAMMSGTPVITSDWGAMTEFNVHGVTGFRCRTLDEMVEAARNIHTIQPENCRAWAMSKFSTDVIALEYERYFTRIKNLSETLDYERIQAEEQPFADRLGPCLVRHIQPKKFLDIGCGPGMHVRVMDSLGIESLGIELDKRASHPLIKNESLLEMNGRYTADLVMSLEVGEHLDASLADTMVRQVYESIEPGGTLVWTSAQMCQVGGIGHVNCQPKEYWIEKFVAQGLVRDETLENVIKDEMLQGYHMGWFILNLIVFRRRPELKVAVWTEQKWALGRIARSIQKYMDARVNLYDWTVYGDNEKLFIKDKLWKNYDKIITKTDIFDYEKHFHEKIPDGLLEKCIVISHCPKFDCEQFYEKLVVNDKPVYCGVSQETCDEMKRLGVQHVYWTPFGVDTDDFPLKYSNDRQLIQKIGIVGGSLRETSSIYTRIKGFDMFEEICKRVGAEPIYIHGQTDTVDLYKGIDLLICCSEFEAGPLGIFEAAACGVPVLTRRVGNAQYIKGIATFDTVEEAVQKIQAWSFSNDAEVTREVRTNWSMKHLIQKHLQPLIETHDIRDFPLVYMYGGKTERQKNMEQTLETFQNVTRYDIKHKSMDPKEYHMCYNRDLVEIMKSNKLPFIFMEDDCSRTEWFTHTLQIPSDADAIYLGNSEWSVVPGSTEGSLGTLSYEPYDDQFVRVHNMLGMHAVLVLSDRWRQNIIECSSMGVYQDVMLARTMKDYTVYALRKPIFYQDPKVGGTQTPVTFDTIPCYKGDIDFRVFDFIEIGTSDFDTEIQKANGRRGLSIEPIKRYLDALPDCPGVQKVHAAISNYDGHINIYSVENPEQYGMPRWIRGCNSVNTYHPTTLRMVHEKRLDEREVFTVERVRVMSFSTLVKEYNVCACRYLKIDTEGHDIVILESYLESGFPLIPVVRFEANCLTDPQKVQDIQTKLQNVGYVSFVREGDDIVAKTF